MAHYIKIVLNNNSSQASWLVIVSTHVQLTHVTFM